MTTLVPQLDDYEVVGASGTTLRVFDERAGVERDILDMTAGAGAAVIGYGDASITTAMAEEVRRVSHVLPAFRTRARKRVVEELTRDWLPSGLCNVHLTTSGTMAVEFAMALALAAQSIRRPRESPTVVLGRTSSYHGGSLRALSVGGHRARRAPFRRTLDTVPHARTCDCVAGRFGDPDHGCGLRCVAELKQVIEQVGPENVAALIAEPVAGTTGVLVPHPDYWRQVRKLCREHDILLIADKSSVVRSPSYGAATTVAE